MKIQDLDALRPEPKSVRIGGQDIDVSFIPCGITFDVDEIMNEIRSLDQKKILTGGEEARKAFNLSVRLCSKFCSYRYSEMDEDWFMKNASPIQVQAFAEAISEALTKAYLGVGNPQKAARTKKKG